MRDKTSAGSAVIKEYRASHTRRTRFIALMLVLSVFVGIGVFWQLRLTGVSMSGEAYCGFEEHEHSEKCVEKKLVCTLKEEDQGHIHTDACYEDVYICGFEPEYSHVHTLQCYSHTEADIESASVWERSIENVELTGIWAEDLLAIAKTQLGYRESTDNYQVQEDGSTMKGITRYGQWYGDAYGDWCAMFVSWCLNYAGISNEYLPYHAECQKWVEALSESGFYEQRKNYTPVSSDIIFFDSDQDGLSDHVGIVSEVTENDGEAIVHTIEGNSANAVSQQEYALTAPVIMGYADLSMAYERYLADQPENQGLEAMIFTDESYTKAATDGMRIIVAGALPEDAMVYAYPVEVALEDRSVLCAYDITMFLADGSIYEPDGELTVQFIAPEMASSENAADSTVYYIPESGDPEEVQATVTEEGISFTADHFSVYAWVQDGSIGVATAEALANAVNNAGGTRYVQLTDDITTSQAMSVSNGAKVTIDLNGHRLTFENNGNQALFTVPQGAALTIIDIASDTDSGETETGAPTSAENAGHTAEITANSDGSFTLSYYVTKPTIINLATGATSEACYKREVTSRGIILSNANYPLFSVSGGALNIGSGFILGAGSKDQAIEQSNGTVEISGGYICGFTQTNSHNETYYGGAVRVTGGTLNITGSAVIAGNTAPTGGAIANLGGIVNISGGVISGNTATLDCGTSENNKDYGGGGVYAKNATVNISAGYVTENVAICTGYFNGGGGILLYSSTLNMSGGYITGNQAASGGGIRTVFADSSSVFINGGYICSNYVRSAEGGGICIDNMGYCEVDAGKSGNSIFVNNNATNTVEHWGGGGLFVANGGTMFIRNALITENLAGGYGGGVAGCSTGRVVVAIQNGAAIYQNNASGEHWSGSTSTKNDDRVYAALSQTFLENGYADYYCALSSTVYAGMLGDYSANWSGSVDGEIVANVSPPQILFSSYIMGLTAHPSATAIEAAIDRASLYINGNYSYTHGGGILSNGYLLIGNEIDWDIGDSLQLEADKAFLDSNGRPLPVVENEFTFEVVDEMNNVVSTGKTLDGGAIYFDRRLSFLKGGTYSFIIRETESNDPSVLRDTTEYLLTVTVVTDENVIVMSDGEIITYRFHRISHIKLTEPKDGNETVLFDNDVSSLESSTYHYDLPSPSFTNYQMDVIDISVNKEWVGAPKSDIQVTLFRNGEAYNTQTLHAPSWSYTWEDLPVSENGMNYSYTVKEAVPEGYVASYAYTNEATATYYWVPATSLVAGEQYMIVNSGGGTALSVTEGHQNVAFTTADKASVTRKTGTLTLGTASYSSWYEDSAVPSRATFTAQSFNGGIILKCNGASANTWLLVQNANNNFLKGTSSANYASLFEYHGRLQGRTEWSATGALRNVIYQNSKFTTGTETTGAVQLYTRVSSPITISNDITITNTSVENELFTLHITKQDADNSGIKLPNATFQLLDSTGAPISFVGANGSYERVAGNALPAGETAVTNVVTVAKGRLVLTGLPAGTYTLHEVAAPDGYYTANDETIVLGSGEGNSISITIRDKRMESFVLPKTGGTGIVPYLLGGMLLLATAVYLMQRQTKRKREDA